MTFGANQIINDIVHYYLDSNRLTKPHIGVETHKGSMTSICRY